MVLGHAPWMPLVYLRGALLNGHEEEARSWLVSVAMGFHGCPPTDQLTSCVLARSGSDRPSHAVDIVTVRMPVVMTGPETASLHQP